MFCTLQTNRISMLSSLTCHPRYTEGMLSSQGVPLGDYKRGGGVPLQVPEEERGRGDLIGNCKVTDKSFLNKELDKWSHPRRTLKPSWLLSLKLPTDCVRHEGCYEIPASHAWVGVLSSWQNAAGTREIKVGTPVGTEITFRKCALDNINHHWHTQN